MHTYPFDLAKQYIMYANASLRESVPELGPSNKSKGFELLMVRR